MYIVSIPTDFFFCKERNRVIWRVSEFPKKSEKKETRHLSLKNDPS